MKKRSALGQKEQEEMSKSQKLEIIFENLRKNIKLKLKFRLFFWKQLDSVRIKDLTKREFKAIKDKAGNLININ